MNYFNIVGGYYCQYHKCAEIQSVHLEVDCKICFHALKSPISLTFIYLQPSNAEQIFLWSSAAVGDRPLNNVTFKFFLWSVWTQFVIRMRLWNYYRCIIINIRGKFRLSICASFSWDLSNYSNTLLMYGWKTFHRLSEDGINSIKRLRNRTKTFQNSSLYLPEPGVFDTQRVYFQ